jgi:protein involved in polysaccharide export with SLBB domain
MTMPRPSLPFPAFVRLPLVIVGLLLCAPLCIPKPVMAQTMPTDAVTETGIAEVPPPTAATPLDKPVEAPKNPIALPKVPQDTPPVYYNWDGKRKSNDPTQRVPTAQIDSVPQQPKKQMPLPLFLYDYFAPARRIIEARRAAQRSQYTPNSSVPNIQNSGRPSSNSSSPNAPRLPRPQSSNTNRLPNGRNSQYSDMQAQDSQAPNLQMQDGQTQDLRARDMQTQDGQTQDAQDLPGQEKQGQDSQTPYLPYPRTQPQNQQTPSTQDSNQTLTLEQQDRKKYGAYDTNSPQTMNNGAENTQANGYAEAVDPLTQMLSNLTASIPPSYQLAPGDALTVRYWSATHPVQEFTTTVDPQGAIMLDQGRRVVVRGLTLGQAENLVRLQIGHLYRNVEVALTLKELRSISITVGGQAFSPGTYVVPSVATAFNVLYAAGGPTEDGSLRKIEIRRRGHLIGLLDVYKFVTVGSESGDISLQPGDLIYIPPRISRVTVEGEVGSPAIFELTTKETLSDGLHYAGGVKPSAVDQHVQISTVAPGTARVLKDVDLRDTSQSKKIPLYDGDTVFSVRSTLVNSVTIEGAIDQPGDYALTPGLRVADLLQRARGVLPEAYPTRADLYRWNPNNTLSLIPINLDQALAGDSAANIPLVRWDRLKVYTRQEVAWTGQREVTVRGAVQRPGIYYRSDNLHVRDLLLMAGGPTPEASLNQAVLLHQRGDGTYAYKFVQLAAALQGDAAQDATIQDNDILAVYKVGEAQFTPNPIVSIQGDVVTPGDYPHGTDMKLSDLLKLAGGLRPGAAKRITVAHARHQSTDLAMQTINFVPEQGRAFAPQDDLVLQDGDVVTVQGTGGFKERVELVTIQGAVNSPGPVVLRGDKMRLSEAIQMAGGLRPEAYPEGVEFNRSPDLIGTAGQRSLAQVISRLNDMINRSGYQRELAKSDIERIKATGSTITSSSSSILTAPGAAASSAPGAAEAAVPLTAQLAHRDLVSAPRVLNANDLTPSGNVAVNVAKALRRPGSEDDITLMNGDTITIPIRPTTIQVIGAVINARAVLFHAGDKVDYYVANAGGFTPDAARDRIVVIHTGGGLIPADKAGPLQPGDVIVVPTKVVAEKISNSHSNGIDDIFRSITSSAIVYKLATSLFGL